MKYVRKIILNLLEWKESASRKPLILRGARQVGKTTLVNQFSKYYDNFISLNLERQEDVIYFQQYTNVQDIFDAILLDHKINLEKNQRLLLFIDEIQEEPKAIHFLRYFYEELPFIHVIAAGSLLEFALAEVKGFPVGRVEYRYVFPFNFAEFLTASENNRLVEAFNQVPVSNVAHQALMNSFHEYAIIGGMPEAVKTFFQDGNMSGLARVYESIWTTYVEDVEKYTKNDAEKRVIRHILKTAPAYLDERVKFQNFGNSNYRSREVGEAFRNLDDARILQLIYPTTDTIPPLKSDYKKSPRLQFLDTGIVNNALGIQGRLLGMSDLSDSYKGALIPHIITQELLSLNTIGYSKPNFWVRDKTQSSAEVDLVIVHDGMAIPIEIKSGKTGSLKSLHEFIDRSEHPYAVRIYGGKHSIENHTTPKGTPYYLLNLPYYLGTKISAYLEHFIATIK